MGAPPSFGRHTPDPAPPAGPVMHLGDVQASLTLRITDESLHVMGTQIANMVANATAQGFDAGWKAATADAQAAEPPAEPGPAPGGFGPGVDLDRL